MTDTRTPLQTYLDAIDAANAEYAERAGDLVACFNKEIDVYYRDPMVHPYTMRCSEVDRLVDQYHVDRGGLIVQRDAKIRAAAELYLKATEPTR
jgi:hypothetical protein